MAEENTNPGEQQQEPAGQQPNGAQAPNVDIDGIVKQASDLARQQLLEEQQKKTDSSVTREDINRAIQEQNQRLISAINGEQPKEKVDPLHDLFIRNPSQYAAELMQATRKQIRDELAEEERSRLGLRHAYNSVTKERPDITESEEANDLLLAYYDQTDESLSDAERFEKALSRLDILLEKQGAGKAEERIRKAASISGRGGRSGAEDDPGEQKSAREETLELAQKELEERKNRRDKAKNAIL